MNNGLQEFATIFFSKYFTKNVIFFHKIL